MELLRETNLSYSKRFRKIASSGKKIKFSNNRAAFATFYADDNNKNRWWTPTVTPENLLVEVFLPLPVMLPGALGCHAKGGCTP